MSSSSAVGGFLIHQSIIAEAVINAKKRGVDVEVLFWKAADSPVASQLQQAGITTIEKPHLPLMHTKWMLVDNKTFFNGSANWSKNWFSRNDESAIVLHGLSQSQQQQLTNNWNELKKS